MSTLRTGQIIRFLALSLVASAIGQAGIITVTPVVTPNGPLFRYNYTVTNLTGNDVPVLDIAVAPGVSTIKNLAAPMGFVTAYDPILGDVSFIENTSVFGPSALSGFVFDSPIGPRPTTFTATFADGTTMSGATQGPAVPEPASLTLFAMGGAALLFWRKRILRSSARLDEFKD